MDEKPLAPDADMIRQALRIAAGVELPVTARSLTIAEMGAVERRQWGCLLAPAFVIGLWLAAALVFDPPQRQGDAIVIAALLLALPVLLWAATHRRFRKPSDYVDPGLVVEVSGDGVTVAVSGGLHRLDFAQAAARFSYFLRRRGNGFNGLVLSLPGRPVAIGGPDMLHGLQAAAALVAGLVAAGVWADPAVD